MCRAESKQNTRATLLPMALKKIEIENEKMNKNYVKCLAGKNLIETPLLYQRAPWLHGLMTMVSVLQCRLLMPALVPYSLEQLKQRGNTCMLGFSFLLVPVNSFR